VLLAHALFLGPWGLYCLFTQVQWDARFMLLLCTSAIANAAYFFALTRAYGHAPVALVYPLVRSSPLLIAIWSLFLFAESLSTTTLLGIALNVAGLLLMAASGRGSHEGRAMPWAFLAMLATSIYSLSDKAATAHVSTFGGLIGYITVGYLMAWGMLSLRLLLDSGRWTPRARIRPGAMIGGGYALELHTHWSFTRCDHCRRPRWWRTPMQGSLSQHSARSCFSRNVRNGGCGVPVFY
jgi:drug/metabolite transporter (DMT)-like permease